MSENPTYQDMTNKNMKLMGKDLNRQLPLIFISSKEQLPEEYDLLIIENTTAI